MRERKKLKLKKFYLHPITVFLLLTIITVILSAILSAFQMQASYSRVNQTNYELETVLVTVENMLNFDGMKYMISNATRNFLSFAPLGMLLITLIGISIANATGFIDTLCQKVISKIDKKVVTFFIMLLAIFSSLINEIGYVLLIPLAALIYQKINRNPFLGIITAFCGVSFGYGVSIFIGSMETNLIPYTTITARLIDETAHISLTSNLYIIIAFSAILSFIGTFIIEKIIVPRFGRIKEKEQNSKTEELLITTIEEEEQLKIEKEKNEKRGMRFAFIAVIILILAFIYMIIPNLPYSGLLLDMTEDTYLGQLFGSNSYFQDGFTYMISIIFAIVGIAYGIGAKTIKNDKDIIAGCKDMFAPLSEMIILLFVVSQFNSVFKQTNIGTIITSWCASTIGIVNFTGIPLIIFSIIMIAVSNLFITTPSAKWSIFAPIMVPAFMQSNISPQFAQFILRAGHSMTAGITPLLAGFAIYIGYLNIYNHNKEKPITIRQAINYVLPYCAIIGIAWILLILGWYLIGLPLGPKVFPTI